MIPSISSRLFFAAFCFVTLISMTQASDWPQWRGPSGMGICEDSGLPLSWGGKDNENVVWKVPIPKTDVSQSSPIVWKDKIFITTAVNKPLEQRVTCFKKSDGTQLWSTVVPEGPWIMTDLRGGYSCSTPCTDGERVYAVFGSSTLAALDFEGKIVWQKSIEPRNFDVAISASPILYKNTLILLCDQKGTSFIAAYDLKTGDVKWTEKRPTVNFNHSTPLLATVNGKPQLLIGASNALQGADPENGKILWSAKAKGDIATPVFADNLAYVDDARGGLGMCVDATGSGDVTATNVKWSFKTLVEGFNSPIIADGRLYRLFNQLKCFDLKTGELVYAEKLGEKPLHASPFVTPDGRIYYASSGTTWIVKTGPKFELLGKCELGDPSSASAAVSDGRIILKGAKFLFCIGKK